ncbi:unnamed protein product, partial [Tilletia caries]
MAVYVIASAMCEFFADFIPYNTGKFATMKVILEIALKFTNNKKADLSGGEATVYKLGSGLIAGFATARHYHL